MSFDSHLFSAAAETVVYHWSAESEFQRPFKVETGRLRVEVLEQNVITEMKKPGLSLEKAGTMKGFHFPYSGS